MMHPKKISIRDYSYELPDERIAKYPLEKRDESKLLYYKNGSINTSVFKNAPDVLPSNALLVYNNTKVIRARMIFYKSTGAKVEIFCLEPHQPVDYAQSFQQTERVVWRCMVGNARKWKEEALHMALDGVMLTASKIGREGADFLIEFSWDNDNFTFSDMVEKSGNIPIPPYLNRESEASDLKTYQTVYAKYKGSVAAPTAGLHFTDEVLSSLRQKGVQTEEVTLHVGAGTFQPVKAEAMEDHPMHTETIAVSYDTIKKMKSHANCIIAVGTTSVRTLESIYWIGALLSEGKIGSPDRAHLDQWTPYEFEGNVSLETALAVLVHWMEQNECYVINASTQIIIAPGYEFKVISGMFTNFHQPQSTLLLLVSALIGDDWRKVYRYAMDNDFRFLSYGDSSLLMR